MAFRNEITECSLDQPPEATSELASEAYQNMADLLGQARRSREAPTNVEATFGSLIFTNPHAEQAQHHTRSSEHQPTKQAMDAGAPQSATADAAAGRVEQQAVMDGNARLCSDPQVERNRLEALARAQLSPDRLGQFQQDLAAFERRACDQGLAPREVAGTMQAVSRLLETRGGEVVSAANRLRLAEQVMHQAAVPTDVNQGHHSTCSVASMESMLYTRNPSRIAELVADVATTGQFQLRFPPGEAIPDPRPVVRLRPQSLVPDHEARARQLPDGDRSYASQLFQITAANVYYAMDNAANGSQTWYVQRDPIAGRRPPDSGERVIDFSHHPPRELRDRDGRVLDSPELSDGNVVAVANHILGDSSTVLIRNADRNSPKDPDDGEQLISATTSEQMAQRLTELQSQGRFPAIVIVQADQPPFAPAGKPGGGSMAWHFLTITNFNPSTDMVSLDNQWGRADDLTGSRALPVADLLRLGRDPDATRPDFSAMQSQIEAARSAGNPDYGLELGYLQSQRQYHCIDQPQYELQAAYALAGFLHSRGITTTENWEQSLNRDDRRLVGRVLRQLHERPGETRDQRGSVILRLAAEQLLRMPPPIECR